MSFIKHTLDNNFKKRSIQLILYISFFSLFFDCSLSILFGHFSFTSNCFIISFFSNILILIISILVVFTIDNKILINAIIPVFIGSVGIIFNLFKSISIIIMVWHGIFAFFIGITIFQINYSEELFNNIQKAKERIILINLKDELWSVIKINLQLFLSFAAIVGVCMSILFGLNYGELDKKMSAIRMVFGSGIIASILYIWTFKDYINIINLLRKKDL